MSDERQIHEILIDRDIEAFVAGDWSATAADFDEAAFVGYSGADGTVRLQFPTLDSYRESWLSQAAELAAGPGREALAAQLGAAQRISRIEIAGNRALAVKIFDGTIDVAGGEWRTLQWSTYYFLRLDSAPRRWLITGFMGYLPTEWNAA